MSGEISVLDEWSIFPWPVSAGVVYEKAGESNFAGIYLSNNFCVCTSDDTGY